MLCHRRYDWTAFFEHCLSLPWGDHLTVSPAPFTAATYEIISPTLRYGPLVDASAKDLTMPAFLLTPSKGDSDMTKLPTAFQSANQRRDVLLGQLRKAHRDLAQAENNIDARRKALIAIEEAERALWRDW